MSATAVLAVLSTVGMFIDNSLVKRLLQNIAKKTTTKLDDWVVDILYQATAAAAPAEDTEEKLGEVQRKYDEATPEAKADLKSPGRVVFSVDGGSIVTAAGQG